jgi:hypothetical protein
VVHCSWIQSAGALSCLLLQFCIPNSSRFAAHVTDQQHCCMSTTLLLHPQKRNMQSATHTDIITLPVTLEKPYAGQRIPSHECLNMLHRECLCNVTPPPTQASSQMLARAVTQTHEMVTIATRKLRQQAVGHCRTQPHYPRAPKHAVEPTCQGKTATV